MAPARLALELHRRERGVVAADGDELRDVQPQQRVHRLLEQGRVGGGIGAGDAEVRAAAEMDPADGVDGERRDVIDVPLHQPFEAVADADDVEPLEPGADGGGGDDAVDAGRRPAADEDGEAVMMFHGLACQPKKSISLTQARISSARQLEGRHLAQVAQVHAPVHV